MYDPYEDVLTAREEWLMSEEADDAYDSDAYIEPLDEVFDSIEWDDFGD